MAPDRRTAMIGSSIDLRLTFIFTIYKILVSHHRDPRAAKSIVLKPRRPQQAAKKYTSPD
jgi:hypothetical protein